MQCHVVRNRASCGASNAYSATEALWHAFAISPDRISSHRKSFFHHTSSRVEASPARKELSPRTQKVHTVRLQNRWIKKPVDHTQDIIADHLPKTLEAHRASNRASVIRAVPVSNLRVYKDGFFHPVLQSYAAPEESDNRQVSIPNDQPTMVISGEDHASNQASYQHGRSRDDFGSGDVTLEAQDQSFEHSKSPPDFRSRLQGSKSSIAIGRSGSPKIKKSSRVYVEKESRREDEGRRNKTGVPRHMRTAASFETDISVNGHLRPGKGSYTLNYEGRHIPPRQSNSVSGSSLPWMLHPSLETLEGFERLRVELQAFDTWIKPTAAEHAAREAVVHDVFAFAKKIIPESSLELFGSHRTGLSVATSDIDFRIYQPDVGQGAGDRGPNLTKPSSRKLNTRRLQLLYSAMAEAEGFMVTAMRPLAKYPLMTVQHLDSGVDIQIVVSNDTVASREYIKKYLAQYPALGTVYMVIKMMLNVRGLSDVYHGGLGSYSIFMMVVASLELHYNNRRDDLAQHLLSFFSLYSKLDTSRMGVSVDPPMLFAKTPNGKPKLAEKQYDDATAAGRHQIGVVDPLQPYLFCLQDPADSLNDLGKRSYGIKHIQETIRVLHKGLLQKVASPSKESLLSPLVGGCYELIEERRSRLEAYGEPFLEAKQEVLR